MNFYGDDAAIETFFDQLRAGTAKPSIIWIAGNQASNDLSANGAQRPSPTTPPPSVTS
ncbi:MAG: hypothetical protein ABIW17_07700 [Marmoricola sp.]